jgi:hypothetical protein
MMSQNHYTRTETSALVNNDVASYKAAKMRNKKELQFNQLLEKVDKLEQCVENLKCRIKEIEKNGNN